MLPNPTSLWLISPNNHPFAPIKFILFRLTIESVSAQWQRVCSHMNRHPNVTESSIWIPCTVQYMRTIYIWWTKLNIQRDYVILHWRAIQMFSIAVNKHVYKVNIQFFSSKIKNCSDMHWWPEKVIFHISKTGTWYFPCREPMPMK